MSEQKNEVRRFYGLLWDAHDPQIMPSILRPEFTFRGSLGPAVQGRDALWQYVDRVHAGLANYHCVIRDLIEEDDTICARMNFSGIHAGEFLGFPASGEALNWDGRAIFTLVDNMIVDVWVLGDLKSLYAQLHLYAEQPQQAVQCPPR